MSATGGAKLDGISVSTLRLVSPDGTKVMYQSIDNSGTLTTNSINPLITYVPNILNNGWVGTVPADTGTVYTGLQVSFDGIIGSTRTIATSPTTTVSSVTLVGTNILQFNWNTTGAAATTLLLFTVSNSTNTGTRTRILSINLTVQFFPNNITGLVGWWDASDSSTVLTTGDVPATNGQTILKWNDKSGFGNHFDTVNVNSPTYATGSINGKGVIDFRGGSVVKSLRMSSNFTSIDGKSTTSIFWVATFEAASFSVNVLLGQGGAAGQNASQYINYNGTNHIGSFHIISNSFGGIGLDAGPSTTGANNIAFMNGFTWSTSPTGRAGEFEAYYHDNTRFVNKYGRTIGTTAPIPSGQGPLVIGAGTIDYTFPNFRYIGRVAEMVIYDNSISDVNYVALESYFNTKWGLSLF